MAERRPLTEGLKPPAPPINPKLEKDFVYGQKPKEGEGAVVTPTTPAIVRSPLSTRIRSDFKIALKQASLERQIKGVEP